MVLNFRAKSFLRSLFLFLLPILPLAVVGNLREGVVVNPLPSGGERIIGSFNPSSARSFLVGSGTTVAKSTTKPSSDPSKDSASTSGSNIGSFEPVDQVCSSSSGSKPLGCVDQPSLTTSKSKDTKPNSPQAAATETEKKFVCDGSEKTRLFFTPIGASYGCRTDEEIASARRSMIFSKILRGAYSWTFTVLQVIIDPISTLFSLLGGGLAYLGGIFFRKSPPPPSNSVSSPTDKSKDNQGSTGTTQGGDSQAKPSSPS